MRKRIDHHMRVRQLLSIHTSKLLIMLRAQGRSRKQIGKNAAFVSDKKIPEGIFSEKILITINNLVMSNAGPLVSLGVHNFQELIHPTVSLYFIPESATRGYQVMSCDMILKCCNVSRQEEIFMIRPSSWP